jgi:hypothetical protein
VGHERCSNNCRYFHFGCDLRAWINWNVSRLVRCRLYYCKLLSWVSTSHRIYSILFSHFECEIVSSPVIQKWRFLLFAVCGTCPFAINIVSPRSENNVEIGRFIYHFMRKMRFWVEVILLCSYCQACHVNSLHFGG